MQKKYVSHRFMISPMFVAKVIGISGTAIKKIQNESGARVAFEGLNNANYPNGRVLSIKALEAVPFEIARQMVEEICGRENMQLLDAPDDQSTVGSELSNRSNNSDHLFGSIYSNEAAVKMKLLLIPSAIVSELAGQDQANLKELKMAYSLSSIELLAPCTTPSGEQLSPVCLYGAMDKVEDAKSVLDQMVMDIQQQATAFSNSESSLAKAIAAQEDEQMEDDLESSPRKSSSSTYSPCSRAHKRAHVCQNDEDEVECKMRRQQLNLLEEQQEYYKKRCQVADLQIEQLKMDNYWKRTELKLPACLTIDYNGEKVEICNQFVQQETSQTTQQLEKQLHQNKENSMKDNQLNKSSVEKKKKSFQFNYFLRLFSFFSLPLNHLLGY